MRRQARELRSLYSLLPFMLSIYMPILSVLAKAHMRGLDLDARNSDRQTAAEKTTNMAQMIKKHVFGAEHIGLHVS